jgi:hypothetical protein
MKVVALRRLPACSMKGAACSPSRPASAPKMPPARKAAMNPEPPRPARDAVGERRPGDGDDLQPGCRDQVSASGDAHDRADGHAARIVFAVIIVEESNLPHTNTILVTTYAAVGLSVLAHGLTAALLADRYASWYESHPHAARPPMESVPTTAHRLRGNPRTDDTAQTAVPLSTQT